MKLSGTPFVAWTLDDIEQTIPQRFARIVAEHSHRLALKTRATTWNYEQLDHSARSIAHEILQRRGDSIVTVGLLFDQGAWVNAATLGALMARKIYVPLDPTFPPAQMADVVHDAELALVLTDHAHLEQASALCQAVGLPLLNVESITPTFGLPALSAPSPDDPAYIFYTSGSTGKPKGVLNSHRNTLHTVLRYTNQLHIHADDRLTLLHAPAFSATVSSLFSALLNGAACFPVHIRAMNPDALAEWLIQERVTIYHSVPVLFRSLMREGRTFPDVRVIRLEGDQATRLDVDLYRTHFSGDAVLVNGLGTTETNLARQFLIDPSTKLSTNVLPVGYPVPDMRVLILDDAGNDLGKGQVGEIAVQSRYLAVGYWKNPEATAAKFLPDPQGGDARIYRTGDLGRLRADDCLDYLGRQDFRVKVRGQFVEPAEIENALLTLPNILAAAVVARKSRWDDSELVAFVVAGNDTAPSFTEWRAHLAEHLPEIMVPARFVLLDTLPLHPNGKLDRRALQALTLEPSFPQTESVAPRNETQSRLAHIWETVLDVRRVGIHTPFLERGGDSICAFRILARVHDEWQIQLTPREFFAAPTVGEQARLIQEYAAASIGTSRRADRAYE